MKKSTVILVVLSVALLAGCALPPPVDPAPPPVTSVSPPAIIPEIALETNTTAHANEQSTGALEGLTWVKGQPVAIVPGTIYVIELWATWSKPCQSVIPHLTALQETFKEHNVVVVGISNEADITKVESFVMEQGDAMNYHVATDPSGTTFKHYLNAFGRNGIPTAFIVDAENHIVWSGHPRSDLEHVLEQVVQGTFNHASYIRAKDERIATEQALRERYRNYIDALLAGKPISETRPLVETYMDTAPPNGLNALAWQIITMENVPETSRDYDIALKAATKANEATCGKDPLILDTYALALSRTGHLAEAVVAQRKAVELTVDNERLQTEMTERLKQMEEALKKQE